MRRNTASRSSIEDSVTRPTLKDAVKFGVVSLDATMKSNVSVGPPVDILCYESDSLQANMRTRLDEDDPYLEEIGRKWQDGIIKLVKQMPAADFAKPVRRVSRAPPEFVSDFASTAGRTSLEAQGFSPRAWRELHRESVKQSLERAGLLPALDTSAVIKLHPTYVHSS